MADKRNREPADEEYFIAFKSKRTSFLNYDEVIKVMKYEPLENFVDLFKNGLIENINALNAKRESYLMIACDEGLVDCTRVLIENGANLNLRCVMLESALHKACDKKHLEIIKLLLISGVDLHEDYGLNHAPLVVACDQGDIEAADLCLERGLDINSRFEGDVLIVSYKANRMNIVTWLLEHNYDVNFVDDQVPEDNPLIHACEKGWTDLVQFLFDQGADVNIVAGSYLDQNGGDVPAFPLFAACRSGHLEIVKLLIERGADIHKEGEVSLVLASAGGFIDVVELLLTAGSYVNSLSSWWPRTALIAATVEGHIEMVELLLDNGAEINIIDDWGDSALVLACECSRLGIMHLLIDRGADVVRDRDHSYYRACAKPSYECAKAMLELGADPNTVEDNTSALSFHCRRNISLEHIELLLEFGADPNYTDGGTPLHNLFSPYSKRTVPIDCARKLLDYGADVTIADWQGRTALDLAGRFPELLALCAEYRDLNDRQRLALEPVLK